MPSSPSLPLPSCLSGHPFTPQVTLIPSSGNLTVQLTAMYPGTREDTLQYSISMSASSHSRWQTGQQTLPVTNLTAPVSGSAEVALGSGTYSITVTVTNQHGSTTSVPQKVTIPSQFSAGCWSCQCWLLFTVLLCSVFQMLSVMYRSYD